MASRSRAVLCWTSASLTFGTGVAFGQPDAVEDGWYLSQEIVFESALAARWNPLDERVYVCKRRNTANFGGLYVFNELGEATQLAILDNPAGLAIDPATGDAFLSLDFPGTIQRVVFGTTTASTWVSGFHSGDDDPIGLAIAPADYRGGLLSGGEALVVDRGSSGPDEVWRWSPSAAEGETAAHVDDGTLVDPVGVAISAGRMYIIDDLGSATPGVIYELDYDTALPDGGVVPMLLSEPLDQPRGIDVDPSNQDLIVYEHGGGRVLRVDEKTGAVSEILTGLSGTSTNWGAVDIFDRGRALLVTDQGDGKVFLFRKLYEECADKQLQYFANNSMSSFDEAGAAVAIDGTRLVVGFPGEPAVRSYQLQTDGTWALEATIASGDQSFGEILSLDGDRLAVGAPSQLCCSPEITLFEFDGANWQQTQSSISGPNFSSFQAVCLRGEDLFVQVDGDGTGTGSVVHYRESTIIPGVYFEHTTLSPTPDPGQAGMPVNFGAAIDCDGKTLVIGAPGEETTVLDQGVVYVYRRDVSGDWQLDQKLVQTGIGPQVGDGLGAAVAVDGNSIIAGSPTHSGNMGAVPNRGWVTFWSYLTEFGGWVSTGGSAEYETGSRAGSSVDISGERAIAGAPGKPIGLTGPPFDVGEVEIYEKRTSTSGNLPVWRLRDELEFTLGAQGDLYGASVAISNDIAVIGMPGQDVGGFTNTGAVDTYWVGDCQDCNTDGVPDVPQIRAGMTDADADGFPDNCENITIFVTGSMHPDIQTAVDHALVRSGSSDIIYLQPGTYAEQVEFDRSVALWAFNPIVPPVLEMPPAQDGALLTVYRDGINLKNLEFRGDGTDDSMMIVDPDASTIFDEPLIFIDDCEIRDFGLSAIDAFGGNFNVTDTRFVQNGASTPLGGAINGIPADITVRRCEFIGNHADVAGGAILLSGSESKGEISECLFLGNYTSSGVRGCIFTDAAVQNTFINGSTFLEQPGPGNNFSNNPTAVISHSIWNCIFSVNGAAADNGIEGPHQLYSSLLEVAGGISGNIVGDPVFTDAPNPGFDGIWGTFDTGEELGDLTPAQGSPVIDAGDTTAPLVSEGGTDLAGNPRLVDAMGYDDVGIPDPGTGWVVDIGANEAPENVPPPVGDIPGDLNNDGQVNIADLNLVLGNFGSVGALGIPGDANGDGQVNISDLNLVIGNFGESQ